MHKKTKKITYLGINASYSHSSLAFGCLKAYAQRYLPGMEWLLLEATVNDQSGNVIRKLANTKPDIVLSTLYLFNHEFVLNIIKKASLLLDCMFILGGPEFLGDNRTFLLENPEVSAVIRGDESALPQVLRSLDDWKAWETIKGLCFVDRKTGQYVDNNTATMPLTMDELPFPYFPEMFASNKPFCQLETSRGCNSKCSFCTSSLSDATRSMSVDRVLKLIGILRDDYQVREIRIIDRTFNESAERSLELIQTFIDCFPAIRFHLEINPALIFSGFVKRLSKAPDNQFHIETGIQTFNPKCLRQIKRTGSSAKSLAGLQELCKLTNISVHADLVAGLPGQQLSDIIADVTTLIQPGPTEIQLETLKVLPGTELRAYPASEIIWNPRPPYEVLRTEAMSYNDLYEAQVLSSIIDKFYNPRKLNSVFRFCWLRIPGFCNQILAESLNLDDPLGPLNLKIRFSVLARIAARGNHETALGLLKFAWLAAGLAPSEYGLKPEKKPAGPVLQQQNEREIWRAPSGRAAKRVFTCLFGFNAGETWLNPLAEVTRRKTLYRFEMAQSNAVASIAQLPPQ